MKDFPGVNNAIEFILGRELPAYQATRGAQNVGRFQTDEQREIQRSVIAKGDRRQTELAGMPRAELYAIWRASMDKLVAELDAARVQKERERFFHAAYAEADCAYWARMSYWTAEEGAALCMGKDPRYVKAQAVEPLRFESPFAAAFMDTLELAQRAAASAQLATPCTPDAFISWARGIDLAVPAGLENAVTKYHPIRNWAAELEQAENVATDLRRELDAAREALAKGSKALDPRERITLLNIIGALTGAADIDLSQHTKAGDAIALMLAEQGITISGRRIGEHLKSVKEAMDSRKA